MIIPTPSQQVLERLRKTGWQQRYPGPALGPNCLVGALDRGVAVATSHSDILAYTTGKATAARWARIIRAEYPERVRRVPVFNGDGSIPHVVVFNDHPETTFADIERVLEKAAAEEAEQL